MSTHTNRPNYQDRTEDLLDAASFSKRFFKSERFSDVFQGGMALVEEAANYLEGPGRQEAKKLSPDLAFAYATESMRLTTRLMQIASWLLIRRAVLEGDMSSEQATEEEQQLKLKSIADFSASDQFEQLPATFRSLIIRSLKLYERVLCMEKILGQSRQIQDESAANGARSQQAILRASYGDGPPR